MIYLRQSKDHEGTGLAVERQLEDCRSLVERRGWEVTRVITDNDVSASSTKVRPGYRELLAEIDAKGCDVVVAWAPDRLLRRPIEMEDLIDRTERTGVKIVTCQNDMDLESPAGRLAARMFAVVARSEVENKSLRQKRQARQAAEKGLPPARRCFGYEQGGMVVNETEAAVVRDAYARVLSSPFNPEAPGGCTGVVRVWHEGGHRWILRSCDASKQRRWPRWTVCARPVGLTRAWRGFAASARRRSAAWGGVGTHCSSWSTGCWRPSRWPRCRT